MCTVRILPSCCVTNVRIFDSPAAIRPSVQARRPPLISRSRGFLCRCPLDMAKSDLGFFRRIFGPSHSVVSERGWRRGGRRTKKPEREGKRARQRTRNGLGHTLDMEVWGERNKCCERALRDFLNGPRAGPRQYISVNEVPPALAKKVSRHPFLCIPFHPSWLHMQKLHKNFILILLRRDASSQYYWGSSRLSSIRANAY